MILTNKVYDNLKWVAQYLLPGCATLYFALSEVWGLPYTEQIVGTIVAVDAFLGALLGISTNNYNKARIAEGYISESPMVEEGPPPQEKKKLLVLSDGVYSVAKWIVMIVMPSAGSLYFALSQLWGFPYGQQVVGSVAAVTAFFGLLLGVSSYQYRRS